MRLFFLFLFLSTTLTAQTEKYEDLMAQDWPNLNRYKEANKKIDSKPKVVFMGNSITEGWANNSPEFFSKNDYLGRGIGGQTTPQMLLRFRQDVIDLQPKAVVILAGTNDIAGNTGYSSVKMITDNIASMAQLAKANEINVIICSILPVYDYPWRPGLNPSEKIIEINEWLKNYSEENGHSYVDFHSEMKNDQNGLSKELAEDGVHPTAKGYSEMEKILQKTLDKVFSKN